MQYDKTSDLYSTLVTLLKSHSKHFAAKIIEQVTNHYSSLHIYMYMFRSLPTQEKLMM